MTDSATLFLYSTTVSDVGYVRSNNQDSSFAGERLIAICDGMGGHAGGDTASTIAIRSLAHIERADTADAVGDPNSSVDVQSVAEMMENSVLAAHDAIVGKARRERKLAGMGTTVTAIALVQGHWVLAHIGDSRAYLLRDGRLIRMTEDHSYVQHLIDTGRITPTEAKNHPQRNVVMRVLGDFDIDPRPDISMHTAKPADRWLLCSDGLCGVLEDSTIATVLASVPDQNECAQQLVQMALKAGSTDNVTAVVGDATLALDANAFDLPHQTPLVGGAASASLEPIADIVDKPVATAPKLKDAGTSPASRAAKLVQPSHARNAGSGTGSASASTSGTATASQSAGEQGQRVAQPSMERAETGDLQVPDTGEIPVIQKRDGRTVSDPNDPEVAKAIVHEQKAQEGTARKRKHRARTLIVVLIVAVLAALGAGTYGVYAWSQSRYYLGNSKGVVAIYQGVPTDLFGLQLSHEVERTDIAVLQLPENWREQLRSGITVDSLDEARERAQYIADQKDALAAQQSSSSPSASAPASASPSQSAAPSSAGASPAATESPAPSASQTSEAAQ